MSQAVQLVLFARYPTPGECKTRLIPALGPQGAARVHRTLTERTLATLQSCISQKVAVKVAITGAGSADFAKWLGNDVTFERQAEGGLTERLLAFLTDAPVIFFGADTPDLSDAHVKAAIAGLARHEVVIGPAEDGGYYLIGMRRPLPELFTDMPWSTDEVLPETLRRLKRLAIEPLQLDTLADCDRPADLERWPDLIA